MPTSASTDDAPTPMVTVDVLIAPSPPLQSMVIVYAVDGDTSVGVPEITPVAGSKVSPAGRDGAIVMLVVQPVVSVITDVAIASPTCASIVWVAGNRAGGGDEIPSEIVAVAEFVPSEAVTV